MADDWELIEEGPDIGSDTSDFELIEEGPNLEEESESSFSSYLKPFEQIPMKATAMFGGGMAGGIRLLEDAAAGVLGTEPTTFGKTTQDQAKAILEEAARREEEAGTGSVTSFLGEAGAGAGSSIPYLLAGPVSLPAAAISGIGNKYGELRDKGAGFFEALPGAFAQGAVEGVLTKRMTGKALDPLSSFGKRALQTAGAEGLEEAASEVTSMGVNAGILGEVPTVGEAVGRTLKAGALGGISGATLAVPSQAIVGRKKIEASSQESFPDSPIQEVAKATSSPNEAPLPSEPQGVVPPTQDVQQVQATSQSVPVVSPETASPLGDLSSAPPVIENATQKITEQIERSPRPEQDTSLGWWDRVRRQFDDRYVAPLDAYKKARGDKKVLPLQDFEILLRNFAGRKGKFDSVVENGMLDINDNYATEGGLEWLLEPVAKPTPQESSNSLDRAFALMVAESTLERAKRIEGKGPISGIGGGGRDADIAVANQAIQELSSHPDLGSAQEFAKRYRQFANANLQRLRDAGRISQKTLDEVRANNVEYVAMQRVLEASDGAELEPIVRSSLAPGASAQIIKKATGSGKKIKNPIESLLRTSERVIIEGDRNRLKLSFVDQLDPTGSDPDLAQIGKKVTESNSRTIDVYRDGEKETWELAPDIARAFKGLDGTYQLPEFITFLPKIFHTGTVYSPRFIIRNRIRDTLARLQLSRSGGRDSFVETFKPLDKKAADDLRRSGGYFAGNYTNSPKEWDAAIKRIIGDPEIQKKHIFLDPKKLSKGGLDWYKGKVQEQEIVNRVAEFKAAYKKATSEGLDDANARARAAYEARDLIDFAVAGETMAIVTQIVPFSNATVRGLLRTARGVQENPKAFMAKWTLYSLLPTLLVRAYNSRDEETKKEYAQIPVEQRDLFYNLKVGPDRWLSIPKDHTTGLFAASAERLLNKIDGDPNAFEGHAGNIFENLSPIDDSALAGPAKGFIEVLANRDLYRDRPINPTWEAGLDLELRKESDFSTAPGKVWESLFKKFGLGSTWFGRKFGSARSFDHLNRSLLGSSGTLAAKAFTGDISTGDITGLGIGSPANTSQDSKFVNSYIERRGVGSRNKALDKRRVYRDMYYATQDPAERDYLARQIREEDALLRDMIERIGDPIFGKEN